MFYKCHLDFLLSRCQGVFDYFLWPSRALPIRFLRTTARWISVSRVQNNYWNILQKLTTQSSAIGASEGGNEVHYFAARPSKPCGLIGGGHAMIPGDSTCETLLILVTHLRFQKLCPCQTMPTQKFYGIRWFSISTLGCPMISRRYPFSMPRICHQGTSIPRAWNW